jgi:hypothetical protein
MDHSSSRKKRAGFFRLVTDCNHVIKYLIDEFFDALSSVSGDIDPDLIHDFYGIRINLRRLSPRALSFILLRIKRPEKAFCHLRPARVMGADEQDFFLFGIYHFFLLIFWILSAKSRAYLNPAKKQETRKGSHLNI